MRNITREIKIGNVCIGGNNKIAIQSMTNTLTENVSETVKQIKALEIAGCDIIRVAVPCFKAAYSLKDIKKQINIPIIADIHFNYKLAVEAIKNGADKIRINPGNLSNKNELKEIILAAKHMDIPIRIGVNSGSLEKEILYKYGGVCSDALVESALNHIKLIETMNFEDLVIAIKSSNVLETIESYTKLSKQVDYPMHIGVTESGTIRKGTIKSSVGIGCLLSKGIGDTVRVSLTGDPLEEIIVAKEILKSLGLLNTGIELISCPTCGRCNVDLVAIANSIDDKINNLNTKKTIKIAVMGCEVNGPGEARDADLGIAGSKDGFQLFVKGELTQKVPEEIAMDVFIEELKKLL